MEWIGPLLIGGLVFLSVLQLFWAYTISAIAEKTDQSELMQVLAWIPILQLAPTLAAGGSSIGRFGVVGIALLVGNGVLIGTAALLGGSFGTVMMTLGIGLSGLLCLVYFGRIASHTATARDLPGWLGLLVFVPVLNFFIYPYIAFHDGWVWPNKVGLAIGSVLMLASSAPTFQALRMLDASGEFSTDAILAMAEGMAEGDPSDPSNAKDIRERLVADFQPPALHSTEPPQTSVAALEEAGLTEQQQAAVRVLYQLKSRFDTLDSLTGNAQDPTNAQRVQSLGIIESIRRDLDLNRSKLDSATYMDLARHLIELEARLEDRTGNSLHDRNPAATTLGPLDEQIGAAAIQVRSGFQAAGYDDRRTPPTRPFPVQANERCPAGTERRELKETKGELEWCQQPAKSGGLRHGWYAKYLEDGQPESMGQYENGLRVGVWTRFYPSGKVRAQAEFEKGMQHGWTLAFDKSGQRTRSAWYDHGALVKRP